MQVKNCRKCHTIFQSHAGRNLCGECYTESQDTFIQVRNFLYDNPGSNSIEVLYAMNKIGIEITLKEIQGFVSDGRLVETKREPSIHDKSWRASTVGNQFRSESKFSSGM